MLVLTRKFGQKTHIGDDITVTVFSLGKNKIRLAIEAPRNLKILREELLQSSDCTLDVEMEHAEELMEDLGF